MSCSNLTNYGDVIEPYKSNFCFLFFFTVCSFNIFAAATDHSHGFSKAFNILYKSLVENLEEEEDKDYEGMKLLLPSLKGLKGLLT